jgi:hypothetical protein
MTITLQDPAGQRDPSSRHAFPDVVGEPKLSAPATLAEELLAGFPVGEGASEVDPTRLEVGSA